MRALLTCVFSTFLFLGLVSTPARAGETLTVYTYESFVSDWGPGPGIKASFEAACDCQLNWVGIQDGVALLNRLKLEGASSKADLVLGLDTNLIAEAKATGLFSDHGVSGADVSLPIDWNDSVFVPYDFAHFAVVYDRDKITQPPSSLKELVEGDSDHKIVIQDPRTSTPGLGLMLWMKSVYGDGAPDAWASLKSKVLTVTPGWSEAYGLFTKGEAEMVLSYTTSPAYHRIVEESQKYAAAAFSEGHYLQVEVAGMLKDAANPDLAKRFLNFMTGPGFQDHIPTSNWMFPAGKLSGALPDEFTKLVKPSKTFLYSPEDVAANRRAWTDEWLNVMSQ